MDSTNVYAYISIIALIVCLPPALIVSELINISYFPLINTYSLFMWISIIKYFLALALHPQLFHDLIP